MGYEIPEEAFSAFMEINGYLRGWKDAIRSNRSETMMQQVLDNQRRQMSMERAHFRATLRTGQATRRIERRLDSFKNLLLDTVNRITETLDVITDRYYERTADELVAKWLAAAGERAEHELEAACHALVGETAWGHLAEDSQRDLRAHAILKRDWRPEHARLAAMALCVAFERELRLAFVPERGNLPLTESPDLKELLGRANSKEGTVMEEVATLANRRPGLAGRNGLRNRAAHPSDTFTADDLAEIERKLLSPPRGEHALQEKVTRYLR